MQHKDGPEEMPLAYVWTMCVCVCVRGVRLAPPFRLGGGACWDSASAISVGWMCMMGQRPLQPFPSAISVGLQYWRVLHGLGGAASSFLDFTHECTCVGERIDGVE